MNYLKAIRTIFVILAFIGFFLALGAIGASDFADEIGEYIELKDFLPQLLIGTVLMLPCGLLEWWLDRTDFEERGKEHDNRHCIAER